MGGHGFSARERNVGQRVVRPVTGFPITRINPITEAVVQQFSGTGGGVIQTSTGAVWLSNLNEGTVWRVDPKRIVATLAE